MKMAPLGRKGLHDLIINRLGLAILRGELVTGNSEICSELLLCRTLQVSRTALREAIKVLASKGLVELRPKVGVRVRPRSEWRLLDPDLLAWQSEAGVDEHFIRNLCEVRLVVETAAAELAATRATAEERDRLQQHYDEMERNVRDKAVYDRVDIDFHEAIFAGCHNELLQQMSATISTALRAQNRSGSDEDVEASLLLHKEIAKSICQRKQTAARAAMENLIRHTADVFYQAFHPGSSDGWRMGDLTARLEEGDERLERSARRRAMLDDADTQDTVEGLPFIGGRIDVGLCEIDVAERTTVLEVRLYRAAGVESEDVGSSARQRFGEATHSATRLENAFALHSPGPLGFGEQAPFAHVPPLSSRIELRRGKQRPLIAEGSGVVLSVAETRDAT